MKNSTSRRQETPGSRRSRILALNPCILEVTALTTCELNRVRSYQISFVEPR